MPVLIKFLSFAFIILQTPANNPHVVIHAKDTVTQYSMARNGTIGILAHTEDAGYSFEYLEIGNLITVEYPDHIKLYRVQATERWLAYDPYSIFSTFENIETHEVVSAVDLGPRMYYGYNRLVLQTCYDGVKGRLFVFAHPLTRGMERKSLTHEK